jgi:hypothetical protein
MSFADCVENAVRAGWLARDEAERLYQRRGEAAAALELDLQHSPESALRMAEELGLERAKQNVRLRKYQAALQAIKNSQNHSRILNYQGGETRGVRTLLARDSTGVATWSNVEGRTKAVAGQAHARMAEGLSALRTRTAGLTRDNALLDDVVREALGEATGNTKAAQFAKVWSEVTEELRQRFNRAGGNIPKRADWGMPQSHDALLVGRVSQAEWIDFTLERLDIQRMVDPETGAPHTEASLRAVLGGVYETIRTNGLSDMTPGAQGGKKLANRRNDARFLVFRDAESWMQYQDRFGSPNLFGTMMDHIQSMSRDVALLEIMGPNPAASFRYLQDVAKINEDKPIGRRINQAVWNITSGTGDPNRSPHAAHVFGAIRSWNVAARLGSASLSAVSDLAFIGMTAAWNGMPVMRTMQRYLSQLNPANEADRILATRIGITALSWSDAYSNISRFSEIGGGGTGLLSRVENKANQFAEFTIRASGLNAMTDAGRRAFALEYAANIAENAGKRLEDIEGPFGQSLRSRGMTSAEWDMISATPMTEHNGAKYWTVDTLMERTDLDLRTREQLAARVQEVIQEEMLYAVPEPDALARVITTGGGAPRGSIMGELARTGLQFKSFPIAVLSLHAQRMMAARQLRGAAGAAAYAATGIIATTALGYLALNLKLISKGQDPRSPDEPATWAAAFVQGGGMGLYGDFLFSDVNRFGKGPVTSMLGPSVDLVEDAIELTWGNVQQRANGEDTDVVAEMVDFASKYAPFGNLWYSKLLLEREIIDQAKMAADPAGARRSFRAKERRAREQGASYYWRPGQRSPSRAPELEMDQ